MKHFKSSLAACGVVIILLAASCNNAGENGENDGMNNSSDSTTLNESRRNTTDTVNYLTGDSANQSQDAIDPNPPGQ